MTRPAASAPGSGPSAALERLRRWEVAGGAWHVVRLGPQEATVELERCDLGEPVGSITSTDAEFLAHLRDRAS